MLVGTISTLVLSFGCDPSHLLSLPAWAWAAVGSIGSAVLASMAAAGVTLPTIRAGQNFDASGRPISFTLTYGEETVNLDQGKTWAKVDTFKWVTRGVIEGPQGFHIHPNGDIDINGKDIKITDPKGPAKLEQEINKRHDFAASPTPSSPPSPTPSSAAPASIPGKPEFKVNLDKLGHLMVVCIHGADRIETSIRGLDHLVERGLMIKPRHLHLDPLGRHIEIDELVLQCDEAGARELETVLNAKYTPELRDESEIAIHVTENVASTTGFDLHFATVAFGERREVHEHLSQPALDALQDSLHCHILQPGIVLRVSPPYLMVRRKGDDAGEVRIPSIPDLQYRAATCEQIQSFLNHPLLMINARASASPSEPAASESSEEISAMRVVLNPQNRMFLWIECLSSGGDTFSGKAFTHRNIADWLHHGVFADDYEVALSIDNRVLSVLKKDTRTEERITLDHNSPEAERLRASEMLTSVLRSKRAPRESPPASTSAPKPTAAPKPPAPPPVTQQPPRAPPATKETTGRAAPPPPDLAKSKENPPAPAPPAPEESEIEISAPWLAIFDRIDAERSHLDIFARLVELHGSGSMDLELSLDRVFSNRRFEILSFSHAQIKSVLELRSAAFHGFYVSHVNEHKSLLVYAKAGRHLEWAPDKCLLQPAVSEDPRVFDGKALIGMAIHSKGDFGFVVTPECKRWAKTHEAHYLEAGAVLLSPMELAAAADDYSMVWPAIEQ